MNKKEYAQLVYKVRGRISKKKGRNLNGNYIKRILKELLASRESSILNDFFEDYHLLVLYKILHKLKGNNPWRFWLSIA